MAQTGGGGPSSSVTGSGGGGGAGISGATQRVVAGGIVFFSLVTLADIPATSKLAVAFAYLILLSAALTVGPVAFGRVSALVGG